MMQQTLSPAKTLQGAIVLPGDRAISHCYAALASIARGSTRIKRFSTAAECQSTLRSLEEWGVAVERLTEEIVIHGKGLDALADGMPVRFSAAKNSTLLAGLGAEGDTIVEEAVRTPDHMEIALREFGADITVIRDRITLHGPPRLTGDRELIIPGDFSIAAYFIAGALLLPGSQLSIYGVGLNPSRTLFLDLLASMGAQAKILDIGQNNGEVVGDIQIKAARAVRGGVVDGAIAAALRDELPALAVLGAVTEQGITAKDAGGQGAMIAGMAENLRRMGIRIDVTADGFHVPGKQQFQAASANLDSRCDSRIAMACAIASLAAAGSASSLDNAEAATDVFPEFYSTLQQVVS